MDINNKDNDLFKIDESSELIDGKNVSDKKGGKVAKKAKAHKEKKSQSLASEEIVEDNLQTIEIATDVKITKDNLFDILDQNSKKKNIIVPRKIRSILNKINSRKRKIDDGFYTKNTPGLVIEVKNASKYYVNDNIVTRVLKNVSMDVRQGELMLIYGISGGGKSTLLNLISGLDRPSKGDVIVCDENLPYLSNNKLTLFRRKHVSFIFQNYNLLANLNAYDNVETGGYLQTDKNKKLDIVEMFKKFEMEEEMHKFPSQMSGGQQQRVSIMRALSKNSEIIFADEPTGALDESTTKIVLRLLYEINKQNKTTVVMVSHNPVMAAMADRIVHVVEGRISKIEVNQNPIHPDQIDLFKGE
ncbi:ABC transporter ATP-binding protein [Mycoplasmopsis agalactiae]|uniref:ABC transporter ATP binding protein n=1 Tax=Mycoplasmopsis agalactiae TaxID=2110 RepID=D3VRV9_MYCAA|nr:ABC transporter ATP-binding protein [Mycoplasmopsis agalactiae]KAB6718702.1 ABC transporter ATP-binding protein [Mycoplasmopsis agalactiae]CBH41057.1 ABC transporter ATP binding protein [Mycoplasmopsis agalactiae]